MSVNEVAATHGVATGPDAVLAVSDESVAELQRMGALEAAERELAVLRRQLRRERLLGKAGHWGYDLTRHLALTQLVKRAEAAFSRRTCAAALAHQARGAL